MTTVTLPPTPSVVPTLEVDPGAIDTCGDQMLAASAQIDDLGTFVAGGARVSDWTGDAASAYHADIGPVGGRADAMSLALRSVARRVQLHADRMIALQDRHTDLDAERTALRGEISGLRTRISRATEEEAPALQTEADVLADRVATYEGDLRTLASDLTTEETAMRDAFERVLSLEQIEDRYAGAEDPADDALATRPPAGSSPEEVNRWWEGLTEQERQAILAASPGSIGNLDGIPAEARSDANTVSLDRDLAEWRYLDDQGLLTSDEEKWLDNAESANDAREEISGRRDPITDEPIEAQVYIYDPSAFDGDGRIAISAGDLDTADNVAVVVPGLGTDGGSAGYQADRAATIYESSRYLDPSQSNASLFWIGYDAPDNKPWALEGFDVGGVTNEQMASAGGERLADTVDGLRASRDGDPAHLTVIGHSYGSTTTGIGAHDHGLDADDIVVVGSPGLGGDTNHASDLNIDPDHVWAGRNSSDVVAALGNHGAIHGETLFGAGLGDDPAEDDFGANRFTAESTTRNEDHRGIADHSKYFDHNTESLHNISQIVNGNYDEVVSADHVHDPWFGAPEDPESGRTPTAPTTVEP